MRNTQNKDELENDLLNILHGIDRTDRMIQQLLMIYRVEAQQDYQPEAVDLIHSLREVVASHAPLALKQQQQLSLDGPEQAYVQGNPILLSILFGNIIDNAIRYSGTESSIEISVTEKSTDKEALTEILISDDGPAIPDEIREKVFEKFFRAHTERGDGAGLGMSIVADIAQLHHGSVKLLPTESKIGNTFSIILPEL